MKSELEHVAQIQTPNFRRLKSEEGSFSSTASLNFLELACSTLDSEVESILAKFYDVFTIPYWWEYC